MYNVSSYDNLLAIIRSSLWGDRVGTVGQNEYDELKKHSLIGLTANLLPLLNIQKDLHEKWEKDVYFHLSYSVRYKHEQKRLPISIPYVILKGTSAAQYYPCPDLRSMGDIDIMTSHEDYPVACDMLLNNGYKEVTGDHTADFGRHRCFSKNGIVVEIHAFFALLNDASKAEWLDNEIIKHINPSHILPDMINGLVLLEHIDQHMEGGIGLRQIIDWMMFVNKCMDEDAWLQFQELAHKTGLEKLALVTTRMCEIYLGLKRHNWCKDVDDDICNQMIDYILSCGNFGNKHTDDEHARIRVLTYSRTPFAVLRHIHERGKQNWETAHKYRFLRPFAWVYQICQYIKKDIKNSVSKRIIAEYDTAKARISFFDSLGITQASKGYAIYKSGKYIKTYKKP